MIPGSIYDDLEELLSPAIAIVCQCMEEVCTIAAQTLANFVPTALHDKSKQLAFIRHQMDVMAYIIETMVSNNDLMIPDVPTALGIFGVDLTK